MKVFTKIKFLVMCLILATGGAILSAQQTVTFASTDHFAMNALYGPIYVTTATQQKSRHAYIYLGSSAAPSGPLNAGSTISALAFLRSGPSVASLTGDMNLKLYLANTPATDLTNSLIRWSTSTAGATLVYDGNPATIVGNTMGWKQFPLLTNFTYTGNNIAVFAEYSQAVPQVSDLYWTYDNAGYAAHTTKYTVASGTGGLSDSLSTTQSRHPQMRVIFTQLPCSGTPNAGTLPTITNLCGAATATLRAIGGSSAPNIAYQWEESTNQGITWGNAVGGSGATTDTYITPTLSTRIQYRLKTTCTHSNASATTVATTISPQQYASMPYNTSFEADWVTKCAMDTFRADAPDAFWVGSPASGNASWRQDNTTTAASGWSGISGNYSPTGAVGTRSARFHSYNASSGSSGTLDLFVNLSASGSKQLSFDHINPTGSDVLLVQLSENGGATFTDLGTYGAQETWATRTLALTTTSATSVIRFKATSDYGNDDMGIDHLSLTYPCTGTPTAGTSTISSTAICIGNTVMTRATGSSIGSGIVYQWQKYSAGAWSDIAGATTTTYTSPRLSASAQYRLKVTCALSSESVYSDSLSVAVSAPQYASIPYVQSFENWITQCATGTASKDVPDSYWYGTPTTGNASWRRNDQGADAVWSSASGAYTPASTAGTYSARFHSYNAAAEMKGSLDLYVDLSRVGDKLLGFDYINPNGVDALKVQISQDGGTTWTVLENITTVGAEWVRKSYPISSNAATAILRLEATSDYGDSDIGVDNLMIVMSCAGVPSAGAAATAFACPGTRAILAPTGVTIDAGTLYRWEQSTNNGSTWSIATGMSNGPTYTTPILNADTQYRLKVTCSYSGDSMVGNAISVLMTAPIPAVLPYRESFESWITQCATGTYALDAPSTAWLVKPISGNASWRRNDQGQSNGGWRSLSGDYTQPASYGNYSARFHSYDAPLAAQGNMDLYIDLSAPGMKEMSFDYINPSGTDTLRVLLSENGGTSFRPITTTQGISTAWSRKSIALTSTYGYAIIRFEATSDFGTSDIGLDNLTIGAHCQSTPIAGTLPTQTMICSGSPLNVAALGASFGHGIRYKWEYSKDDGKSWNTAANATSAYYSTDSITAATLIRMSVGCGHNNTSAQTNTMKVLMLESPTVSLPYTQDFENWQTQCAPYGATNDVPALEWTNRPSSGEMSWRREDQQVTGRWTNINLGAYTPAFTTGAHSARFHSYQTPTGTMGKMDLSMDMSGDGPKRISLDYINPNGTDTLKIGISTDNGATFTPLGHLTTAATWANKVFTTTASGKVVIRFDAISDYGASDMGMDNLKVVAIPNAGTTAASQTAVCRQNKVTLSVNNASAHATQRYQWQRATDSVTWTNIIGANAATHQASQNYTTFYRCRVACDTVNAFSVPIKVTTDTSATLPTATIFSTGNLNLCQGDSVKLTARTGIGFKWNTGATDSTLTVRNTGNYQVVVSNAAGCNATATAAVTVNPTPTASFSATIAGNNVAFTNLSGGGSTYSWNFGNGQTATTTHPTVTYAANGSYTVVLTTLTASGCRATATQQVRLTRVGAEDIDPLLKVTIAPNPVSEDLTIRFEDATLSFKTGDFMSIIDALGKEIYRTNLTHKTLHINTSNWNTGIYILYAKINNRKVGLQKVVKMDK
jgi:PKD domain/Secretion system C-terminal sorting domain